MIKAKYVLCLLLLALVNLGYSQTSSSNLEDEILDDIESSAVHSLLDNEFSTSANVVQQQIASNSTFGNNAQVTHVGSSNQTSVTQQNGDANLAILSRIGNNNVDNVLQNGNENSYESTVDGNGNENIITQDGDNNKIDQDLAGDNMKFTITQEGSNHELNQVENDGNTAGYSVTQSGNGMKITITNRNWITK